MSHEKREFQLEHVKTVADRLELFISSYGKKLGLSENQQESIHKKYDPQQYNKQKFFDLNEKITDSDKTVFGLIKEIKKDIDILKQKNIIKQRRIDSLARLLTFNSDEQNCVCISCAFIKDKKGNENFYIASSTPGPKKSKDKSSTSKFFKDKKNPDFEIVRNSASEDKFDAEKTEELIKKKLKIINEFIKKTKEEGKEWANENALDYVIKLQKAGGYSIEALGFKNKEEQVSKFVTDRMKKDLLKITTSMIEEKHFTKNQIELFLEKEPTITALNNQNLKEYKEKGAKHAEQTISNLVPEKQKHITYIGVSKLSCVTCEDVLEEDKRKGKNISYRGGHGNTYPNVRNRITEKLSGNEGEQPNNQRSEDSDSDGEFKIKDPIPKSNLLKRKFENNENKNDINNHKKLKKF